MELPSRKHVEEMFNKIAPKYDFANRILSFGIDIFWRKKLVNMLIENNPNKVLDLACGTGDVTIEIFKNAKNVEIVDADLSQDMLSLAQKKILNRFPEAHVSFVKEDAQKLSFDEDSFDAITIVFGIRNVENLSKGLSEMYRVLLPGGRAFILEFSIPSSRLIKSCFLFYLRNIVPSIGNLLTGDFYSYKYLNKSIEAFPFGEEFCKMLKDAGFKEVRAVPFTFGIVTVYKVVK